MVSISPIAVKKDDTNYVKIVKNVQSADATGGVTIWTPRSGKKFVITDIIASTDTGLNLTFKDGADTITVVYLAANSTFVSNFQTPIQSTTEGNSLTVTASGSGNISITVTGYEV